MEKHLKENRNGTQLIRFSLAEIPESNSHIYEPDSHLLHMYIFFPPFFLSLFFKKIFITQSFQVSFIQWRRDMGVTDFYLLLCSMDGGTRRKNLPKENISQSRTPKDHTSLWIVYTRSKSFLGPSTSKGGEPMEVEDKEWEPNLAKTWRKNFHYRCTQLLRLAQKSLDSAT